MDFVKEIIFEQVDWCCTDLCNSILSPIFYKLRFDCILYNLWRRQRFTQVYGYHCAIKRRWCIGFCKYSGNTFELTATHNQWTCVSFKIIKLMSRGLSILPYAFGGRNNGGIEVW